MIIRVTEQRISTMETSYDVQIPDGVSVDDAVDNIEEYLDRERDEISSEEIAASVEIVGTEPVEE